MEINTTFETYVIIDDEEFKVEVQAVGDLVEDGFNHEFGYESTPYISNVFITGIYDTENEKEIKFKKLSKEQQKLLLVIAEEELNEREFWECCNEI
jgi:hypothetical protein